MRCCSGHWRTARPSSWCGSTTSSRTWRGPRSRVPDAHDWITRSRSLSGLALFAQTNKSLSGEGEPLRVSTQRMNAGALRVLGPPAAPGARVRRGRGPGRRAGGGDARRALLAEAVRRPSGHRGEHHPTRRPRPHRPRGGPRAAPLAGRLRGLGPAAERPGHLAPRDALHERRGPARARGDGGRGTEGPPVGGEVDRPRVPGLPAPRHPGGPLGGRAPRRGAHLARRPRRGGRAGAAHRLREPGEPPARPRCGAPARGGGPDGARRRPLAGGPGAAGRGRGALGARDRSRAAGGMGGRLGAPRERCPSAPRRWPTPWGSTPGCWPSRSGCAC